MSRMCGNCRSKNVSLVNVPYDVRCCDEQGDLHDVHVDSIPVYQCNNCKEKSIGLDADRLITEAYERVLEQKRNVI